MHMNAVAFFNLKNVWNVSFLQNICINVEATNRYDVVAMIQTINQKCGSDETDETKPIEID
jgi:hypothetical protein